MRVKEINAMKKEDISVYQYQSKEKESRYE